MINDPKLVRINQRNFLRKLSKIKKPYIIDVTGVEITVFPDVFPPRTDTFLLAENLRVKVGDRILDMATGSGVIAVIAAFKGASGVAVDINPKAVENANFNFTKLHLDMKAFVSDTFGNVPKVKFDCIFAIGPYFDEVIKEPIEQAIYGMRRFMVDLFEKGPEYLKSKGKILATFPEWSDLSYFEGLINKNKLLYKIIAKRKTDDGLRVYRLYKVTK